MAARLSAVGLTPRVTEHDDHTCIETEVPGSASAETWQELLQALEAADLFGLVVTGAGGRTVWAAVSKNAPETAITVRGHGLQP